MTQAQPLYFEQFEHDFAYYDSCSASSYDELDAMTEREYNAFMAANVCLPL